MPKIEIVRIDDNTRGKIVCLECGRETYAPLLGDLAGIIAELSRAAQHEC